MALSPQEIYELDKEIFNFLYNKHLEAKARGEEFYFRIFPHYGNPQKGEIAGKFYWFANTLEQQGCVIYFWEGHHIFLLVSKQQVKQPSSYLIIGIMATKFRPEEEPNIKIENLGEFLSAKEDWVRNSNNSNMFSKKYSENTIEGVFNQFLKIDKPQIDKFISEYPQKIQLEPYLIIEKLFNVNIRVARFMFSLPKAQEKKDNLPISLSRFFIQQYQGIDNLEIPTLNPNIKWIFLTGENAAGKTSILNALYHTIADIEDFSDVKNKRFGYGVEIVKKGTYFQNTRYYISTTQSINGKDTPIIALGFANLSLKKEIPYLNDLVKFLYDRKKSIKRAYQYDLLVEVFKDFLPNLSRIEVDINKEAEEYESAVCFYEKDDNGNELGYVTFDKLAMGHRNILNLLANIILGLSYEKDTTLEVLMPKDLYGIVIIDEFEQHLHPKMQRFLVEKLTTLFPKVQFIVSTHSPIPLLGAPKETAIFHVERTKEKGITIERVDEYVDWENLTPNLMFSSPIFGFSDLIPFAHKKGEKIRTVYSYGNEELMAKLN
jgi:hypothetical protein